MKLLAAGFALGIVCAPVPAMAQSVLHLRDGSISVTIPHGEPRKMELENKERGSMREMLLGLFKPLLKPDDKLTQDRLDELVDAFLAGETWRAMDNMSGQSFSVATFELPASLYPLPRPLACSAKLRDGIEANGVMMKCRDIEVDGASGIEVRTTTAGLGVSSTRVFVGDRKYYQLQYNRVDDNLLKALHLATPASADEAAFMSSLHISAGVGKTPPH